MAGMSNTGDAGNVLMANEARWPAVARFVAAGAVNTLFSIAVYQAALFVMNHAPAYVLAYAAGIVWAYFSYARHVFHATVSWRRFVVFALFYGMSGLAGTLLNNALIEHLGLHARIAIFVIAALMLPVNYFGSRWSMRLAENPRS